MGFQQDPVSFQTFIWSLYFLIGLSVSFLDVLALQSVVQQQKTANPAVAVLIPASFKKMVPCMVSSKSILNPFSRSI